MKFDFRQHLPTLPAQGLEPVQKNGLRCSEARFHIFYYIIVSGNCISTDGGLLTC